MNPQTNICFFNDKAVPDVGDAMMLPWHQTHGQVETVLLANKQRQFCVEEAHVFPRGN